MVKNFKDQRKRDSPKSPLLSYLSLFKQSSLSHKKEFSFEMDSVETDRMTDSSSSSRRNGINKYEPVDISSVHKRCNKTDCLWGFAKFCGFILFLVLLGVIVDRVNAFRNSDPNWIRYTSEVPLQTVSKTTRVSWLFNSQEVVRNVADAIYDFPSQTMNFYNGAGKVIFSATCQPPNVKNCPVGTLPDLPWVLVDPFYPEEKTYCPTRFCFTVN